MWTNKQAQGETPGTSPSPEQRPVSVPQSTPPSVRPVNAPVARDLACLGASLTIKGQITGDEDLQIDGKVEGPISLQGHRLTVGRSARLNSEVNAREVVVYGKASGNLRARDRVEIKKDGEVTGDITTARISIEDGAYFKGRIEIERAKQASQTERETEKVPVGVGTN
jgi:cytoskeletal protein CcmA (bactofilin family)